MSERFETPQDAEDAYYDALEEGDPDKVLAVWADSDDISCLLPMYPLIQGRKDIAELFTRLFSQGQGVALTVAHLHWMQTEDVAVHQVSENIQHPPPDRPRPPPFYGTNIYRKLDGGWRLIMHLNAPMPAPLQHQREAPRNGQAAV